jgi:hypothetical protein
MRQYELIPAFAVGYPPKPLAKKKLWLCFHWLIPRLCAVSLLYVAGVSPSHARIPQTSSTPAATNPASAWELLQHPSFLSGKALAVKNLILQRDRIRVLLDEGTVEFAPAINGSVFGAAFHGKGRLQVTTPNPQEAQQLQYFTKQDGISLEFDQATFCFTDNTFGEMAAHGDWVDTEHPDDLYRARQHQREDDGENLDARLYKGLFSANRQKTGLFYVEVRAQGAGWVEAKYDAMEPEEVSIGRWGDVVGGKVYDTWMSFPAANRSAAEAFHDPLEKADFAIHSYEIHATATTDAEFSATTKVDFESTLTGERVLVFSLDSNLRVDKVDDSQGRALAFFQARERKDRNLSYGNYLVVALPEATVAGSRQTLEFHYGGARVVKRVGDGDYFCESFGWYPVRMRQPLMEVEGDFALRHDFDMTFRIPKKLVLAATGKKLEDTIDGSWNVTHWKSEKPLTVAGFAFGDFKIYSDKANAVEVEILADREPSAFFADIARSYPLAPVGTLSPAAMAKTMGMETANTIRLFESYFGPYPYSTIAVTNIPGSYGQGWPGLLYLSALTFMDETQLHTFGVREPQRSQDVFRAHESSHQWWGHRVSWKSYHDQWLSEGFAQFSGNLYVEYRENPKEYLQSVRSDLERLLSPDEQSHKFESNGPVWMGRRMFSSLSPRSYQAVIYDKGGYILHMLRMMLQNPKDKFPDAPFASMMQDFTQSFDGTAASTEDFKAIVEKHMTKAMDLDGNHSMDWFFRQYVYGTGFAHYDFHYNIESLGDGKFKLSGTLNRTQGPEGWKDALPVYVHVGKETRRIGMIEAREALNPFELVLPFNPEKVSINDNLDTLAEVKQ